MSSSDKYADYVEHPRYSRSPRYTVLNPDLAKVEGLPVTDESHEIPSTEIVTSKSCYSDIQRLCRDCGRPFIFFAEEQIYWYETLGFSVGAVCVMCPVADPEIDKQSRLLRERIRLLES